VCCLRRRRSAGRLRDDALPCPLEPLRQRRGALRPLLHGFSQSPVADLLGTLALDVGKRSASAGSGFQFVIRELRWHGEILPPMLRLRPCSTGGCSGLDGRKSQRISLFARRVRTIGGHSVAVMANRSGNHLLDLGGAHRKESLNHRVVH
jgi:hypothetical protein